MLLRWGKAKQKKVLSQHSRTIFLHNFSLFSPPSQTTSLSRSTEDNCGGGAKVLCVFITSGRRSSQVEKLNIVIKIQKSSERAPARIIRPTIAKTNRPIASLRSLKRSLFEINVSRLDLEQFYTHFRIHNVYEPSGERSRFAEGR